MQIVHNNLFVFGNTVNKIKSVVDVYNYNLGFGHQLIVYQSENVNGTGHETI